MLNINQKSCDTKFKYRCFDLTPNRILSAAPEADACLLVHLIDSFENNNSSYLKQYTRSTTLATSEDEITAALAITIVRFLEEIEGVFGLDV